METSGRIEVKKRKNVIAKVIVARDAIQEALQMGTPVARFDPVVLPETARTMLSVMEDDLGKIIRRLQEEQ
jgi:hypothetical protein